MTTAELDTRTHHSSAYFVPNYFPPIAKPKGAPTSRVLVDKPRPLPLGGK